MTQLTLFGPQAQPASVAQIEAQTKQVHRELARHSDKPTSHQAATELDLPKAQRMALSAARALLTTEPDVTANEIAEYAADAFSVRSETVRKRCHELVTAGLFIEGPPRACRVTGKNATTYHLTRHPKPVHA
jgi:hypothetical protein